VHYEQTFDVDTRPNATAADSPRAEEAKCAFIVVHVSVEEISRGWMWKYIPRPGEKAGPAFTTRFRQPFIEL
jgi:hypothetical protein